MGFSLGEFLIISTNDKKIHLRNNDNSKSYTISIFKISSSFVDNNLLKIKEKGSNNIVVCDFSTSQEARKALLALQTQIDVVRNEVPFIINKGVKNYINSFGPGATYSVIIRSLPIDNFTSYLNSFTSSLFQDSFVNTSGVTFSYLVNGYVKSAVNRMITPETDIPYPEPGPWYETTLTAKGSKKDLSESYPRITTLEYDSATTSWPYSATAFSPPLITGTDVLSMKTLKYNQFIPEDVDFKYIYVIYATGAGGDIEHSHQLSSNSMDIRFNSAVNVNFDGTWTYSYLT